MSLDYEALLTELGLQTTPKRERQENISPPFSKQTEQTYQTRTPESNSKKVKLVLNVNLKDGVVEQLMIYQKDNPTQKVKDFCLKHNLDRTAQNVLLKQITLNSDLSYSASKPTSSNYNSSNKKTNYFSTSTENPGERLFNLASLKQKQKEQQIENFEKEKNQEELEQCRKIPEISKNTNIILNRMGYKKGFMKDKKGLQNFEQVYHQEQDKECTFQPKINEVSKQMSSFVRDKQTNVFDELYEKAKTKLYAQPEQNNVECTFQPQLSQQSQLSNLLADDFLTRVEKNIEWRKERMDEIKLRYEHTDQRTQQLLYKPKIGRSPIRRSKDEPTHEKLYQQSFKQMDRLKELQMKKEIDEKQQTQQQSINEYSLDLVFQQRKNQLQHIFNEMDNDGDGYIKCSKQEIQKLDNQTIQILFPILQLIKERNNQIDFEDFFDFCYGFVLKLPQSEKDVLFVKRSNQKRQEILEFTPKINEKSKIMCQNRNKYILCNCDVCQDARSIQQQLSDIINI